MNVGRSMCAVDCWPELVKRYGELCDQLNSVEDALAAAAACDLDEDDDTISIHDSHWKAIWEALR